MLSALLKSLCDQCYQRICPADEQAAYWFEAATAGCATVAANNLTGPAAPPTIFTVDDPNAPQAKSGAADLMVSRLISFGSLVAFLVTVVGVV